MPCLLDVAVLMIEPPTNLTLMSACPANVLFPSFAVQPKLGADVFLACLLCRLSAIRCCHTSIP